MSNLGAKYVLLRWDIDSEATQTATPQQFAEALKAKGFVPLNNFGPLLFYKLPEGSPLVLFLALSGKTQEENPDQAVGLGLQYAHAGEPMFQIRTSASNGSWTPLAILLRMTRHFLPNGYANAWYIDKLGDYEIIIEYRPQRLLYMGLGLSILTLAACLVFLLRGLHLGSIFKTIFFRKDLH